MTGVITYPVIFHDTDMIILASPYALTKRLLAKRNINITGSRAEMLINRNNYQELVMIAVISKDGVDIDYFDSRYAIEKGESFFVLRSGDTIHVRGNGEAAHSRKLFW